MATSKESKEKKTEKKAEKKPAPRPDSDFPRAYIRLRTVLDALETGVLRYCLDNKNIQKRFQRIDEIEAVLLPIIQSLKDKVLLPGGGKDACAEGLFNCGGVCVPYQCPDKPISTRA
jgi:hypothetical protein